ncbi:MAG TPA: alpha/beta hydrolase, partial [Chroococcales cyanobacterium]
MPEESSKKKRLLLTRALLVAMWIGLVACYFAFPPEKIMFDPSRVPDAQFLPLTEYGAREVTLTGAGHTLDAWFLPNKEAKLLILFSHGTGHNIPYLFKKLKVLHDLGFAVFVYDYDGYARSLGTPSIAKTVEDGRIAYDYVCSQLGYKPEQIVLYGESIGGGVTAQLLLEHRARAAILEDTFCSLPAVVKEQAPIWRIIYPDFPPVPMDTLSVIGSLKVPVLIIHGVLDDIIPYSQGESLYRAAKEPKAFQLLPNSVHAEVAPQD